ncbi:MAG: N-acetyl-gamma-glutamyl-phosphate reductase [Pseudomonadota bacterium]
MKNIAIIGASGYTGAELVRLIAMHPGMHITALAANSKAGRQMADVFPHLRGMDLPTLVTWDAIDFAEVDLCFCALPHKTSQEVIAQLPRDLKIVDLSADFRLSDVEAYAKWYGNPHSAPELQEEAVYGLTEFHRDEIAKARLVAGTGCNAATGQFILRPLVAAGVIDLDDIQLDLKCGVSGAGRSVKEHLLLAEAHGGISAYAPGSTHRHLGEFDEHLSRIAGRDVHIRFQPHLVPVSRGILATAYLKGDAADVHATLAAAYADEIFIEVLPMGALPATQHITGSNYCDIGVAADRAPGRVMVTAALDNLCKGSSGQAIQNANLMLGLEEKTGLIAPPLFP